MEKRLPGMKGSSRSQYLEKPSYSPQKRGRNNPRRHVVYQTPLRVKKMAKTDMPQEELHFLGRHPRRRLNPPPTYAQQPSSDDEETENLAITAITDFEVDISHLVSTTTEIKHPDVTQDYMMLQIFDHKLDVKETKISRVDTHFTYEELLELTQTFPLEESTLSLLKRVASVFESVPIVKTGNLRNSPVKWIIGVTMSSLAK